MKLKKDQRQPKIKKKISKSTIGNIAITSVIVLAHVAVLLAIVLSFRYYGIYPTLFGSLVGIVLCVLIIIDIIFFVGFNHKDLALKIISCVLSVLLLAGGTVGTLLIARANGIVNNVLDGGSDKYETFSGVFVCYKKNNTFSKLEDLANKKVGVLNETTNGVTYLATEELNALKIDYGTVTFNTNTELVTALLDGKVDAIAITSGYRTIYSLERDENSPFAQYLDDFIDFHSFEKELKVTSNKKAKNLGAEPFNVLLIGYSRTDIGSPVGLADSIILASVNPQTYTVSMMSIARDSFVPIPCYGDEYDKINSGRSTSRQCFIDTVEEFINQGRTESDHIDIDYYMELDYYGLVSIVNAIGGIKINNPVEFELDGVYVPAGNDIFADGAMALEFCRERHHMPNGDFDRQQHQKEVIIAIAEKFIKSGDITLALNAMDAASQWMSTDLTLNELTTVFNLLLNTKNYTSLSTFDLVDFQTLRITGSGGLMYYSYSMRLPLWVYLIYQGSYDESMSHMANVLGEYGTYKQDKNFEFSSLNLYERPAFYQLEYPDVFMFTPDPMPAFWANLEGMSLAEAMAWAKEKGVTISKVHTIRPVDANYKIELEGLVVDQSVRYGSLVSEYASGEITVMGSGELDESKFVPDFVGGSYSKAVEWGRKYGVYVSVDFDTSVSGTVGKVVSQSPTFYTPIDEVGTLKIVVKAGTYKITFDKNGHGEKAPDAISVTTGDDTVSFKNMADVTDYVFLGWFTDKENGTQVYDTSDVSGETTVYAHWEFQCEHDWKQDSSKTNIKPTCETAGTIYQKCSKCGKTQEVVDPALGHSWDSGTQTKDSTCTEMGQTTYTCTREGCTATKVETDIAMIPHSYKDGVCEKCGATEPNLVE